MLPEKIAPLEANERWAASAEYNGAISALLAAKRIALVEDAETKAVLWWIQQRSLKPGGLQKLTKELFEFLPRSLGTATMRKNGGCQPGKIFPAAAVRAIRDEMPREYPHLPLRGDVVEDWESVWSETNPGVESILTDAPASYSAEELLPIIRRAALSLPEHLTRLCLDPNIDLTNQKASAHSLRSQTPPDSACVWYFGNLLDGLKAWRKRCADVATAALATTDVSEQIREALDFCFRRRRMILIEGVAGIGKSATSKAWCDR